MQSKSRIYAAFICVKIRHLVGVRSQNRFAENLLHLRTERGFTQEQLCELAEIDRSYLQRIEKGCSNPTLEVVTRLKKALGCSWEVLLHGVDGSEESTG
jgi:transcriptional regulator with XRE-family HTH domain